MCLCYCTFFTCNHSALGAIVSRCTQSVDEAGEVCPQRQPHPLHTVRGEVDCDNCKAAKEKADAVYSDVNLTLSKAKDLLRQLRERVERGSRKPGQQDELPRRLAQTEKSYFEVIDWKEDSEAFSKRSTKGWIHAHDLAKTQAEVAAAAAVDALGPRCKLMKDERYVGGTCIESSPWAESLRTGLRNSRNGSPNSASPAGSPPHTKAPNNVSSKMEAGAVKVSDINLYFECY